jgi:hypothetical protein
MEEVPQQCKSLEVVLEFDENACLGVGVIEQSSFPAFSLRPFEDVPLHFSRDGVGKMRASRSNAIPPQSSSRVEFLNSTLY